MAYGKQNQFYDYLSYYNKVDKTFGIKRLQKFPHKNDEFKGSYLQMVIDNITDGYQGTKMENFEFVIVKGVNEIQGRDRGMTELKKIIGGIKNDKNK